MPILLLLLSLFLASCTFDPGFTKHLPYESVEMKERPVGREIPKSIAEKILEVAPEQIKEKATPKTIRGHLTRGAFDVYLVNTKGRAIKGFNRKFLFPRGSGGIDLRNYISDDEDAKFRMGIKLNYDYDKVFVVFESDAQVRKMGGSELGLGCKKYVDLTSVSDQLLEEDGFELELRKTKYVSLFSGVYYVFGVADEVIYLSRFKLSDSRYPEYLCGS